MFLAPAHGDPVAWPPEFMRNLPPDYLGRLHASMVAGTGRMSRLQSKDSKSTESIGWVRYGQPRGFKKVVIDAPGNN